MRKPTPADADLLLRLYELRRDPELRRARQWFLTAFQPAGWEEIGPRYLSHSDEDRWFRMTTAYWEMVGALVNRGLLHPGLFFDHTGEDIQTWKKCLPWIEGARAALRPNYLHHFERLVRDHEAYRARASAAFLAEKERAAGGPAAEGAGDGEPRRSPGGAGPGAGRRTPGARAGGRHPGRRRRGGR